VSWISLIDQHRCGYSRRVVYRTMSRLVPGKTLAKAFLTSIYEAPKSTAERNDLFHISCSPDLKC